MKLIDAVLQSEHTVTKYRQYGIVTIFDMLAGADGISRVKWITPRGKYTMMIQKDYDAMFALKGFYSATLVRNGEIIERRTVDTNDEVEVLVNTIKTKYLDRDFKGHLYAVKNIDLTGFIPRTKEDDVIDETV